MIDQILKKSIEELDNETILLILSHFSQDSQLETNVTKNTTIQSEEDAREAISSLMSTSQSDVPQMEPAFIVPEDTDVTDMARNFLEMLAEDDIAGPKVEQFICDPPTSSQMSVEAAVSGAILLGAVISWIQTRIHIKVIRKKGETEFKFEIKKQSANNSIVTDVVKKMGTLFRGE
jgi:hypothetical protein